MAVALYLLAVAWQREQAPGAIQQAGQLGDMYVSLRAVESLVLQATSPCEACGKRLPDFV